MSARKDLTRWNRAGLSRFRYVDGNAVDYLEILRQQLVDKFKDPQTNRCEWLNPAVKIPTDEYEADNETLAQRQSRLSKTRQRLLESYHQDRRDWAWEISRTFARACHILTEHVGAYANEGYLGTATQWEHVRRLVEMLDYHPAPPASAFTRLVFIAKGDKAGLVPKGFQVKHSPPDGGQKIVFETLEDLLVDPALNELRPKGWNQPEGPAVSSGSNAGIQSSNSKRQFSTIANGPVTNLQGVGETWSRRLNRLSASGGFKIKDFVEFEPEKSSDCGIAMNRLKELKAMGTAIANFEVESDWSKVTEWVLPDIASKNPELMAKTSGNSIAEVVDLQHRIELIGAGLDKGIYEIASLSDLLPLPRTKASRDPSDLGSLKTLWRATSKPKAEAGQVAMIYHQSENRAEAATITKINESTEFIELLPHPVQNSWSTWPKSEAVLLVSPRWKRKCWLNGSDVIRTEALHGFSPGAYIGWQADTSWKFAKVTKADKRNLRLEGDDEFPQKGEKLYQLLPIEGSILPAEYEAIVLLGNTDPLDVEDVAPKTEAPHEPDVSKPRPEDIFTLKKVLPEESEDAGDGGGLLPPASLPKIGSFLFPSPLLPLDLVKAAVELMLSIGVMAIPSTEEIVIKGMPFGGLLEEMATETDAAGMLFEMLDDFEAIVQQCDENGQPIWTVDADGNQIPLPSEEKEKLVVWSDVNAFGEPNVGAIKTALTALISVPEGKEATTLFQKIKNDMAGKGPLLAIPKEPRVKAVVDASDPRYMFDGQPDKIDTGDWVVGRFDEEFRALKIKSIFEYTDIDETETFALAFEGPDAVEPALNEVLASFRGKLAAEGADKNDASIDPEKIDLKDTPPKSLKVGREVLIVGCGGPVVSKVTYVKENTIRIDPPVTGCILSNLIVYGNVVNAGHGESKPAKILGSGNAARSNQEFTLEADGLSFSPDATKRSGVAAAMDVEVDGRIWQQVSTLKDSAPGDHHYVVRMTEEGHVRIIFGDGAYGRRLPSGKNNIRVRYRVGSGTGGNLPDGSLVKPVNPHPLVKAVLQPLPTAGGGEMENVAALRDNAPATLLALERAVSLSDFSHLAASQSSVWQARAHRQILHGGKTQSVKVVIVPVDGVRSESINEAIRPFLQKHALPGVQVTVESFDPELFDLQVTVRVRSDAFIADTVEKAVFSALEMHFNLKQRKLGQPLYLSEVYRVVEGIRGVENSICVLNEDKKCQVIEPEDEKTVIFLDTADKQTPSILTVNAKDYRP